MLNYARSFESAMSAMLRTLGLTLLALIGMAWIGPAGAADNGLVAGDSLGVGVSMASRLKSVARNSVSIRANGIPIQMIEQAAPGTTVFLSLGTNDAVGNVDGLEGGIAKIAQAAAAAKVNLVWLGPPCVFKPWDRNAIALDGTLQKTLKDTGVVFVSMRASRLCDRSIRAPDGVHFNMRGYHYMWDLARAASGFVPPEGSTVVAEATPRHKATHRWKKRRRRGHKRARASASADATPSAPTHAAPAPAPAPQ
jgi:hypothetical protein